MDMYVHVSIGFNPSEHLICPYTKALSKHLQSIYGHVLTLTVLTCQCTYMSAFVPSTLRHVNRQQCLVDNNLNVCIHVSIGFNPSQHLVCTLTCLHTSTTMCMSTKTSCTYMPTLPSTLACVHVNRQPKPSTIT